MPGKSKGKKEPKKVRNFWDEDDATFSAPNGARKKGLKNPQHPKKLRKQDLYEDDDQ